MKARATGITLIVIAALVSTTGSFALARTALVETPAAASGIDHYANLLAQQAEEEASVQATLTCLAAAGIVPAAAPARGRFVTRISVASDGTNDAGTDAAIAFCQGIGGAAAIEITRDEGPANTPGVVRRAVKAMFLAPDWGDEPPASGRSEKASFSIGGAIGLLAAAEQ